MITNDSLDLNAVTATVMSVLPRLDPTQQQLSLELYRLLAGGQPVPRALLAQRLGFTVETVSQVLEAWPGVFFDQQQRIVGYWGLSLPVAYDSPHKLAIDGQRLSAWCAWDTLFLPQLLGKTANVESTSPISGSLVRLRVTPDGAAQVNPADARMSFLSPDPSAVQKDILGAFCCFVHFFTSREAGENWVEKHDGTFLLSIDEALVVARKKNMVQYGEVLQRSGTPRL